MCNWLFMSVVCGQICKIDHCIHIYWCNPMRRGYNGPYSWKRNTFISISLTKRTSQFCMLFSKWNSTGKHGEIQETSVFSAFPNFIHHFELLKLTCKANDRWIKSSIVRLIPGLYLFLFREYRPLANILKGGITLVHPHSRNKSDFTGLIFPATYM